MYKIIIVDDEASTRNGLKECMPWEKYEMEVAGLAADGESGLTLAAEVKPDIVLTDIRMPFMDGITFARKLREMDEQIQIVFISGHDDVDYMKSALQIEAVDYIMKPVNRQELGSVMQKIATKLLDQEQRIVQMNNMNAKLSQSMPLLREKFLMTLIHDGVKATPNLPGKLEMLEMHLPLTGLYSAVLVHIDDQVKVYAGMSERDKQLISFAMLNICQEIIERTHQGYAFEQQQGEYVCILCLTEEQEEALFGLISDIKETLSTLMKLSVTVGVGSAVPDLAQLPISYKMAYEAASQKLFLGKNQILTIDSLASARDEQTFKLSSQHTEQFSLFLKTGDADKLTSLVDLIFNELTAARPTVKLCHNICMLLLVAASNLALEFDLQDDALLMKEEQLWSSLEQLETTEEMKKLLLDYFLTICNQIQQKRSRKSRGVITEIKQFLLLNYNQNITITHVADHVYMTSTYVCLIFKQETGETINEHLTSIRMSKAKELIMDYKNKLQEVGLAVGYSDPSYFTKQFKKHVGLTPKEYREQAK